MNDRYVEVGRRTQADAVTFDPTRHRALWDWLESAAADWMPHSAQVGESSSLPFFSRSSCWCRSYPPLLVNARWTSSAFGQRSSAGDILLALSLAILVSSGGLLGAILLAPRGG